jgi:chromosome segregation ATPase
MEWKSKYDDLKRDFDKDIDVWSVKFIYIEKKYKSKQHKLRKAREDAREWEEKYHKLVKEYEFIIIEWKEKSNNWEEKYEVLYKRTKEEIENLRERCDSWEKKYTVIIIEKESWEKKTGDAEKDLAEAQEWKSKYFSIHEKYETINN